MATYNKFNTFVSDVLQQIHDLIGTGGTDCNQLSIYLSNTTPDAANDSVKADMAEITNENGYSGPVGLAQSGSASTGTVTVTADSVTITASGGSIGPFQYVVLYNSGTAAASDPLIAWWDYGSSVTLNDGESFTVKFNGADTGGQIFTLS